MTTQRDLFDIPSPCDADWEAMVPASPTARHCAGCDALVHDVASMDVYEAAAIGADRAACVRVTRTVDDRIVTRGRLAVLAASLVLMPAVASAGPRDPIENHQPTERQLERGRAQAKDNRIVLRGELVAKAADPVGEDAKVFISAGVRVKSSLLGRRN